MQYGMVLSHKYASGCMLAAETVTVTSRRCSPEHLRPMHSQQQDSRSAMSYRKSSFPDYNVILRYFLSGALSN